MLFNVSFFNASIINSFILKVSIIPATTLYKNPIYKLFIISFKNKNASTAPTISLNPDINVYMNDLFLLFVE